LSGTHIDGPGRRQAIDEDLLTTLCCLFGAAVLLGTGYGIWDNVAVNLHLVALFASLFSYIGAFSLIILGFTRSRYASGAVVVGVAFAFVVYAGSYVLFKVPSYDSDSMLFNSYSAQLLLGGTDPYTQSMQPGYHIFGVPEGVTTPTLNGDEVYSLSYPALSFLVYVPFLMLGITNLLWVSVVAHLLIMLMLVRITPKPFKALTPFIVFLDPTYFDYTVGGITDVLWIPAGMLTAWYWRRNPVAAAAWLGVASGFKQTPWVIVPFAVIHWLMLARASRRPRDVLLPVGVLLVAFALPNLPFAIWHYHAWLAGVLTPLNAHLVILGTGIAQLATSGLVTISAETFTTMTVASFAIALALYSAMPRRLAFLPFLAPALVFFFASRSLHNYFMYWPIILITYLFANWESDYGDFGRTQESLSGPKAAGLVALGAAGIILSLCRPASATLAVTILGGSRNAVTGRIDTLHVAVTSAVRQAALVHFDVAEQGVEVDVQAWNPRSLQEIGPGERRTYTLSAPTSDFQLESDGSTATQVLAVDAAGRVSYSPPVIFAGDTPKIHNPDLAFWSVGSRPFPVAWNFNGEDWTQGRIAKQVIESKNAVALRATASQNRRPASTLVEQVTDARPGTLAFEVFPLENFDESSNPNDLFGIELRDVVGHRIYYTIDSRRRTAATTSAKQRTTIVVPGRLRSWNTITVDLRALELQRGFILAPSATMVVGAVAMSAEPTKTVAGLFGGVRSFDTTSPSDMDQRRDVISLKPSVAQAPHSSPSSEMRAPLFIDDTPHRADGRLAFTGLTYSAGWKHFSRARDGRYFGTVSRSGSAGATLTLRYWGAGLRLYAVCGPTGGRARVTLDGSSRNVSFFARRKRVRAIVFSATHVAYGEHRFRLIVVRPDTSHPNRRYVNFDGALLFFEHGQPSLQQPISGAARVR
jgi:uncharacterized membrane protein